MIDKESIVCSCIFGACLSIIIGEIHAQHGQTDARPRGDDGLRIMFYNVENLFDTFDDPVTRDEEFTPQGSKKWNYYRYKKKINNLAKTIIAVGAWEAPDVIGLCEVENFQVLLDLTSETPLKKFGYQIIHENSMDSRGIDVALLYLPEKLEKISHRLIRFGADEDITTRDIIYATFGFHNKDTFSIYINHWPSRYGGKDFTEEKRLVAAHALQAHIEAEVKKNTNSKIVIMGDFNDEPNDQSMKDILKAKTLKNVSISHESQFDSNEFFNLSFTDFQQNRGTLTYKEIDHTWFLFDQIIVNGTLINGKGLQTVGLQSHIFSADWLLEKGRPKRTYQGPIYKGGFSDHLPIFLDLYYKK